MIAVTATIGRNRRPGSSVAPFRPLSDTDWEAFKERTTLALTQHAGPSKDMIVETHTGYGVWDGITEESAKITVIAPHVILQQRIRQRLARLAATFDQDAIAFAVADSELIGATIPYPVNA